MVSVCMATYNGSQHVIRQIESILSQLSDNDELIVSDDNSTDDTYTLLLGIKDKRIRLFINSLSAGPVGNFQNALSNARGEYILMADQDDVWLPNRVITMCLSLEKCDLVLTDCQVVDQSLNLLIPSFFAFRKSRPGFWYNLYRNSYVGCCMGFRREVLSYALPFPPKIHMHDWWIGLLVEKRGRVKFLSTPFMLYVRHGNNASPTGERSNYGLGKQIKNRLIMCWYVIRR